MSTISIVLGDRNFYEKIRYPAGEMQVRLTAQTYQLVRSARTVGITARISSAEDIVELCMLVSAIRSSSSGPDLKLILPYLPYARADRRFVDGDCFGLAVFANIINGLDTSVFTLDAHSAVSRDLLKNLTDLSADYFIGLAIADLKKTRGNSAENPDDSLVLLFPDDGARKRYSAMASHLNTQILHCAKVRDKATGNLSGFRVPNESAFSSKKVLLIDDICDGGGTFLGIAEALCNYGLDLSLYVTHGIFSKGTASLLEKFSKIYSTDSFYLQFTDPRIVIFPTHHFIGKSLEN